MNTNIFDFNAIDNIIKEVSEINENNSDVDIIDVLRKKMKRVSIPREDKETEKLKN